MFLKYTHIVLFYPYFHFRIISSNSHLEKARNFKRSKNSFLSFSFCFFRERQVSSNFSNYSEFSIKR